MNHQMTNIHKSLQTSYKKQVTPIKSRNLQARSQSCLKIGKSVIGPKMKSQLFGQCVSISKKENYGFNLKKSKSFTMATFNKKTGIKQSRSNVNKVEMEERMRSILSDSLSNGIINIQTDQVQQPCEDERSFELNQKNIQMNNFAAILNEQQITSNSCQIDGSTFNNKDNSQTCMNEQSPVKQFFEKQIESKQKLKFIGQINKECQLNNANTIQNELNKNIKPTMNSRNYFTKRTLNNHPISVPGASSRKCKFDSQDNMVFYGSHESSENLEWQYTSKQLPIVHKENEMNLLTPQQKHQLNDVMGTKQSRQTSYKTPKSSEENQGNLGLSVYIEGLGSKSNHTLNLQNRQTSADTPQRPEKHACVFEQQQSMAKFMRNQSSFLQTTQLKSSSKNVRPVQVDFFHPCPKKLDSVGRSYDQTLYMDNESQDFSEIYHSDEKSEKQKQTFESIGLKQSTISQVSQFNPFNTNNENNFDLEFCGLQYGQKQVLINVQQYRQ